MSKKKVLRKPTVSNEQRGKADLIISPIPIDRPNCKCKPKIKAAAMQARKTGKKPKWVSCPRDKSNMQAYKIVCKRCGEVVGLVYATDKYMSDWCDLHYVTRTDGKFWYGTRAINISPVDDKVGIECSCGNDTRDFRANTTMNPADALKIAESNMKGRDFGKKNSRFFLKEINNVRKYFERQTKKPIHSR
jgi:hypothetical protein